MALKSTNTINLEYKPETVMKVLTSPEFQKANFLAQGNPAAEVKEVSRTENELVLRADVEEYAKGVTGIDKSRIEKTVTTFTWNLKTHNAKWTYDSPHGKRVNVKGEIEILPTDSGSKLIGHFHVDVKIPLVGGKIEKKVADAAEAYYPKYEELIKKHCSKQ